MLFRWIGKIQCIQRRIWSGLQGPHRCLIYGACDDDGLVIKARSLFHEVHEVQKEFEASVSARPCFERDAFRV